MDRSRFRQSKTWPIPAFVALVVAAAGLVAAASAQTAIPANGMVCTTGPTFNVTTRTGYISLPDGNVVFMWGYSVSSQPFQHPSPVLCVNEGDTVTVVLQNTLPQDVSITFPGQENVWANGQLTQPQFDGTGALTSLTNVAPKNGGMITYSFVASRPGTFIYQSGTNPTIQVPMGLFGTLIVRPEAGPHFVYNDSAATQSSEFNRGHSASSSGEFLVLQSEIDPLMHLAVEQNQPFNPVNYQPRYWLINGRSFPDTIADNGASWLPNQPYGARAYIQLNDANNPLYYLQRIVNLSSQPLSFHPFGKKALVIGQDGYPARSTGNEDLSYERSALIAAPGQTYDGLFRYQDREGYDQNANQIPVTEPPLQNLFYGPLYSGSPYLGVIGPLPPGTQSFNQCGEYYIMAHTLALFQLTDWGNPSGGAMTFLRVDPPGGVGCPR